MYILFGILIIVCLLCFIIFHWRKKRIMYRLAEMQLQQKICLLNQIMEPFGFCYSPSQDIITSRVDAWQRQFGYCSLYDRKAVNFSMVFDCEPVYFDYNGCTWMFEFWKGQYGISAGSETGLYRSDRVLSPWEYDRTLFHSIPDNELMPVSMTTFYKGKVLFNACQPHWWLTGFMPGRYCEPANLVVCISITFDNESMMHCFIKGLLQSGYIKCGISVCDMTVSFILSRPYSAQPCHIKKLKSRWAQFKNRIFCRLYMWVTKPFTCTLDKILYLYYFLPFAFRHMLCMKKCKKQKLPEKCRKSCKKQYGKPCKQPCRKKKHENKHWK